MRDGRRGIRIRSLLILVVGSAFLCAAGVEFYRARDPVRRLIRQSRPGNPRFGRLQAVLRLGSHVPKSELDEVFPILLAAAKDPDPAVRGVAAAALSRRKDRAAEVLPILLVLAKDPVATVRRVAIHQLASAFAPGSPEAPDLIPPFLSALDDPVPIVRLAACQALDAHGQGQRAVPALARLVREGKGSLRLRALDQLMAMQAIPPDLEPTLRAMLESERDRDRLGASKALIQLGHPDAAVPASKGAAAHGDDESEADGEGP
jgi:HEAT repeat protein